MSKALSLDLRGRVLRAVAAGASHRQAGERFGVSAASVSRWRRLAREQGHARPKALGGDRHRHRHCAARWCCGPGGRAALRHHPAGAALVLQERRGGRRACPTRAYIADLLPDVLEGQIEPGRVFDRTTDLNGVPEGYRAMNDREAIKVMVEP